MSAGRVSDPGLSNAQLSRRRRDLYLHAAGRRVSCLPRTGDAPLFESPLHALPDPWRADALPHLRSGGNGMTPADDEAFAALLSTMFDVFDKPLHPATVAVYADALAEFPLALVTQAIRGAMRDAQHFHRVPRPGDLRIRCGAPTAETLMAQLDRALADGYFAPPDGTAPIIRALIRRLGGWKYMTEHMDHETLERRVRMLAPDLLAQAFDEQGRATVTPVPLPTLKEIA